jgi:hypothetical protein
MRCIGLGVPGVLVVGREASRVGGLGDLAVVDLLEGVEALASGRHSVHQMHSGGSFGGFDIFGCGVVRSFVGDLLVGSRAIFLSHEPGALSNLRRKSGSGGEVPRLWMPEVRVDGQLAVSDADDIRTTLPIVYTTILLNNKTLQCCSNR